MRIHYWSTYLHPRAVHLFERQWLANLILWGNYARLCDAILEQYGNFTSRLVQTVEHGGMLEVADVLPGQLRNLARKLPCGTRVRLHRMDAAALRFADASFDRALRFFLLHEQPAEVRARSLAEALRVVRPGGTLTMVDDARPSRLHPLRYLWQPVLRRRKPFVSDLWSAGLAAGLPTHARIDHAHTERFFAACIKWLS